MSASFDFSKPIAIGADHAGFQYKEKIADFLKINNIAYKDYGTYNADSTDYPDFAHPVSSAVEKKEFDLGLLICGSANGVAITANKHQGVRAALCWINEIAALARQHNNANIISIPARYTNIKQAVEMVETFLSTDFEGGRHATRVDKIACQ